MIRSTGMLLLILTQVVSAVSRGGLVLCVHESGETKIEWAWSLCCRTDGAHSCDSGPPHVVGAHGEQTLAADPCSDVPFPGSDALVSPAHTGPQRGAALACCDVVPPCNGLIDPTAIEAPGGPHSPAKAMGSATARALRTVVLLL